MHSANCNWVGLLKSISSLASVLYHADQPEPSILPGRLLFFCWSLRLGRAFSLSTIFAIIDLSFPGRFLLFLTVLLYTLNKTAVTLNFMKFRKVVMTFNRLRVLPWVSSFFGVLCLTVTLIFSIPFCSF